MLYSKIRKNISAQIVIIISILEFIIWLFRMLGSIYTLLNNKSLENMSHSVCQSSGFLWTFINLSIFSFIFLIGLVLYIEFHYSRLVIKVESKRKYIYILIFLCTIFLSSIPFMNNAYGEVNGVSCGIKGRLTRLFIFDIPFLVLMILYICLIISVSRKLNSLQIRNDIRRSLTLKFLLFPLLMIICWIPGMIQKTFDFENILLKGITYFMMPLQGVFIPLIYGLVNKDVKQKFIAFFLCRFSQLQTGHSGEFIGENKTTLIEINESGKESSVNERNEIL